MIKKGPVKHFQPQKYKEETGNFSLQVIKTDTEVDFILYDCTDWTAYEGTYNQGSVRQKIHKEMKLQDLYNVFSNDNSLQNTERQEKVRQMKELKNYKGSYKIQNNGRIEIQSMLHLEHKREEWVQSVVKLSKVMDYQPVKFFIQKKSLEKQSPNNKIFDEFKIVKDGSQQIIKQNAKLKETIEKLQDKLQYKLKDVYATFDNKIKEVTEKFESKQKQTITILEQKYNMLNKIFNMNQIRYSQLFFNFARQIQDAEQRLQNSMYNQQTSKNLLLERDKQLQLKLENHDKKIESLQKEVTQKVENTLKENNTKQKNQQKLNNETFVKKIDNLNEDFENQQSHQKLQNQIKVNNIKLDHIHNILEENLKGINEKLGNQKKQQDSQQLSNEMLESKLTKMSNKLDMKFEIKFEEVSSKLKNQLNEETAKLENHQKICDDQTKQKFKKINDIINELNSFKQLTTTKMNQLKSRFLFVDKTTPNYYKFSVNGNKITRIGDCNWYQILMEQVIPKNKIYSFKIKITETANSQIVLGILDRLLGIGNQYSLNQNYAIFYYCFDGFVYPNCLGIKGVKVNKGETVSVIVDLSKGNVEFKVNDIIKVTVNGYKILTEANRQFVPFIKMLTSNDTVQWIESSELQI